MDLCAPERPLALLPPSPACAPPPPSAAAGPTTTTASSSTISGSFDGAFLPIVPARVAYLVSCVVFAARSSASPPLPAMATGLPFLSKAGPTALPSRTPTSPVVSSSRESPPREPLGLLHRRSTHHFPCVCIWGGSASQPNEYSRLQRSKFETAFFRNTRGDLGPRGHHRIERKEENLTAIVDGYDGC